MTPGERRRAAKRKRYLESLTPEEREQLADVMREIQKQIESERNGQ